ncbi:DDE-type integrase/transposase/recombinase [Ruegeria discodermiae]|uniref:DDE-type integrase/transposase/recombinase n=1 Tax=Ruegeria discodermiae TaxID=3064389 RepID=UPI00353223F9
MYFYRAIGKAGNTLDFMLPEQRNRPAATRVFAKVLLSNDVYGTCVGSSRSDV